MKCDLNQLYYFYAERSPKTKEKTKTKKQQNKITNAIHLLPFDKNITLKHTFMSSKYK